jgi:dihydrofolate reductase
LVPTREEKSSIIASRKRGGDMNCFIIAALTADGKIAEVSNQVSTAWTSKEDKQWFNQRTKEAGVIVMGSTTYATIGRPLPGRLNIVFSRRAAELNNQELPENLRYTNQTPTELLESLKKENYSEVAICGGSSIYTMFMKAGLVDQLLLTIEPVIFGKGVGLFDDAVWAKLKLEKSFDLSPDTKVLEFAVVRE